MTSTSARLLTLLGLLESSRAWSGPELADRLGVTTRTVRTDVERLRDLGYPVQAVSGVGGGYRLGAGAVLPPLLLDDEEAVAIVLGLVGVADGSVTGIEESSVRALTKLDRILPPRLRARAAVLRDSTTTVRRADPRIDPATITAIANACRDHQGLRFDYTTVEGVTALRRVDPQRLVHHRRWYLVGYDTDRDDWRTFRLDRIRLRTPGGPRFRPRPDPDGDAATYLARVFGEHARRVQVTVTLEVPAAEVIGWMRPEWGEVTAIDERSSQFRTAADSYELAAISIGLIGVPFRVVEPPSFADYVRAMGQRLLDAAEAP
ncbi:helix-turn-helix transcriptional regulator [Microlunatus parietis]|uniref:Putative DNA-binding transcriptional regulator YafY n=1 Tax=Microlunatus parietis TaxID=682979 RepID=A0A7Y9I258_9ACTN|nr:WYL domain-containing protein [Microlunatus parietis]NYE68844.1 putative DNA-binding transcriptional regulator YafY [Microlunatus parietis]